MAFDTDLIGAYGCCVDISRTWIAGGLKPKPHQRHAWEIAADQIRHNIDILGPGMTLRDLTFKARFPNAEKYRRYSVIQALAAEWIAANRSTVDGWIADALAAS